MIAGRTLWQRRLAWRSTGEIVGRVLRAASTWVWAQRLGADAFGALTHAWTVNLLLAQAFSLALPALLLREATAHPERAAASLFGALRLRLLLLVPEALIFVWLATQMPLQPLPLYALLFVALSLGALSDIAAHFLMARGRWRAEAHITITSSAVVALVSLVAMALDGRAASAATSVLIGNMVGLVLALRAVRDAWHTEPKATGLALSWRMVAPWAFLGVLEQTSYQLEILWLDHAASHTAVAHFSAVYRVLGLSAPLLIIANQMLLPSATQASATPDVLARLTRGGFVIGATTGLVASVAMSVLLPVLLPILYPFANAETVAVCHRLSFMLVFWFAHTGLVQVALAQRRLRALIVWAGLQLGMQAVLCAWLIPSGGAPGAATAKVIAAVLSTPVLVVLMRRELRKA